MYPKENSSWLLLALGITRHGPKISMATNSEYCSNGMQKQGVQNRRCNWKGNKSRRSCFEAYFLIKAAQLTEVFWWAIYILEYSERWFFVESGKLPRYLLMVNTTEASRIKFSI
jgi:hypothetical protein